MIFIPFVNILNIFIILMMIIVFFDCSSAKSSKTIPKLFQLVIHDDINYDAYYIREARPDEKKMSINEFYFSKHNLEARGIPLPTDKSINHQKERIEKYCMKPLKNSNNNYVHVYYNPAYATNIYCERTFEKLTSTLFTCLKPLQELFNKPKPLKSNSNEEEKENPEPLKSNSNEEEEENPEPLKSNSNEEEEENPETMHIIKILENVPKVLITKLNKALYNKDESDAVKSKCVDKLKNLLFWKNEESVFIEGVISKIGKVFENDIEKEKIFYMCIMNFKNGVTELNKKIGVHTPERISKKDYAKLNKNQKKIYNRKIITLEKNYTISENDKKQILEIDEIYFLQSLSDKRYSISTISKYKNVFTDSYRAQGHIKDNQSDIKNYCIDGIKIMNQLNFKVTKLSYMIYPNKWENSLNRFKEKRKNILKNLKLLDKHFDKKYKNKESEIKGKAKSTKTTQKKNKTSNSTDLKTGINNNHIYNSYENEIMKVNDTIFKRLKTCRAIPGEVYETYVLRLNNNGCVPLFKQLWESEENAMKNINIEELSEFKQIEIKN